MKGGSRLARKEEKEFGCRKEKREQTDSSSSARPRARLSTQGSYLAAVASSLNVTTDLLSDGPWKPQLARVTLTETHQRRRISNMAGGSRWFRGG